MISSKGLLESYSDKHMGLVKSLRVVDTMQKAMEANTPTIASLCREFDQDKTEAFVAVWVAELNELINVARPMNEAQILECASLIVYKHKNITVADMNVIFTNAKTGKYDLFESLSIDKVLSWFDDYFSERCNAYAHRSRVSHEKVMENQDTKRQGEMSTMGQINPINNHEKGLNIHEKLKRDNDAKYS